METPAVANGYAGLGLIGNPFEMDADDTANAPGVGLAIRAASLRMLSAIASSVDDPTHRPVVVEKSAEVVPQFHIAALALVLRALSTGNPVSGVLPAYIPIDMMRVGRVRAVLNVMAERVAGGDPVLTLGLWAASVLASPDTTLPEWAHLQESGFDLERARAAVAEDPRAFAVSVFGDEDEDRSGQKDFETLMRISSTRQQRLDVDPEADSSVEPEDSKDDPFAEVFTTPLAEVDPATSPQEGADPTPEDLLAEYVVAHTKAHLSPVIARGIRAFRAQGTVSMAEELKVTKAPTKTLVSLLTFAGNLYRSGVIVYDRLEYWENVPAELRRKIVSTLTDLRIVLKSQASLVLMLVRGESPEIEEVFAAGNHIVWGFEELESVSQFGAVFNADVVRGWLASASLDGEFPNWGEALLEPIEEGTELGVACEALSAAIVAAEQVGGVPDPSIVAALLVGTAAN